MALLISNIQASIVLNNEALARRCRANTRLVSVVP